MIELARALADGELRVLGRLPDASNLALLCEVDVAGRPRRCIYKPVAGERPLWDFPGAALAAREVLTAVVSRALGWDLVPETTWRDEGPAGPGMCQEWVADTGVPPVGLFAAADMPPGWRAVAEGRAADGTAVVLAHEDSADLMRLALLDELVNNGDRKGGHVLRRADGRLAAIDHGVTFHAEAKLRTVLWGWAGDPVPEALLAEVARAADAVDRALATGLGGLTEHEVSAARARRADLLDRGTFPVPGGEWPALPWPPM